MWSVQQKVFIFCSLFGMVVSAPENLPCRLFWQEMSAGDPIPASAVKSGESYYVVRAKSGANPFQPGFYSMLKGRSYIASPSLYMAFHFEILINPFRCETRWVQMPFNFGLLLNMAVPVDQDRDFIVGRKDNYAGKFFPSSCSEIIKIFHFSASYLFPTVSLHSLQCELLMGRSSCYKLLATNIPESTGREVG